MIKKKEETTEEWKGDPDAGTPPEPTLAHTQYMVESEIRREQYLVDDQGNIITDGFNRPVKQITGGHVPSHIHSNFWGFMVKDVPLTSYKAIDLDVMDAIMDEAEITYLMSRPRKEFTFEEMHNLANLEAQIFSRIRRGSDGFERKQMTTQTQNQNITAQNTERIHQQRRGLLGSLFGGV